MSEYVRMYAWLMRKTYGSVALLRGITREADDRLDEFEFWLTFYQLLAMGEKA